MAQDDTYTTKVYHRIADVDGTTVSGLTVAEGGVLFVESGGAINLMDSMTMSILSDFKFGIREDTITAKQMKNYLIGRNTWSVLILSGTTLSAGPPAGSQPPILPSRIGYFFLSFALAANTHQLSARLARGYQGEELVIQMRGLTQSAVVTLYFSDSVLASPTVIGQSYGSVLGTLRLEGSSNSLAFLRLVCPEDGTWAVIDAGESRGSGGCVVEVPV